MSAPPNPPPAVDPAGWRAPPAAVAAGLGLGAVLGQLLLAVALSGEADVGKAYQSLYRFDSLLYGEIVDNGYHCPPTPTLEAHGNVAFFPGYVITGWLVKAATGRTTPVSLLVAAQLACWGFWTYVFLLFRRWRVPVRLAAVGFLLTASRTAAFYLVAAYSEPLFLMSLVGFLYWSGAKSRAAPLLAALHGFVLTATRISGLPLVVYPVLHSWLNAPREKGAGRWKNAARLLGGLAVAGFASLGAGLFFLYCQVRFGDWDLYMKTQALGWNVRPDYLALLHADVYRLIFPTSLEGYLDPNWYWRFSATLLLPIFAGFLLAEFRWARSGAATGSRERAGVYLAAWLVFYLCVSGTSRLGLVSMTRYVLVPEVLLMLCLVHMLSRGPFPAGRLPVWLRLGLAAWVLVGFGTQIECIYLFTHGFWVA